MVSSQGDTELASLSNKEMVNAFNIHLCAVFDGPAALKAWLSNDAAMKQFFQLHTSQKWYQHQDHQRTLFLQSSMCSQLVQAARQLDLDLELGPPGDVYHIELVSKNARNQLRQDPSNPPTAVVCILSKEQLQWYVPIAAENTSGAVEENRCRNFRFMFRGAVQKMRHLQAMGYRTAAVWVSEWNALQTDEARTKYLRDAVNVGSAQSTAFTPVLSEDTYM